MNPFALAQRRWICLWVFASMFLPGLSYGFDSLSKQESYLNIRRGQMLLGFTAGALISDSGVTNNGEDFGFRLGFGYSFTRRLRLEFIYQFSVIPFESPDPLSSGTRQTNFHFNSETFRLVYRYDRSKLIPYGFLGLGLYQLSGISSNTGLDFSTDVHMPAGLGIETYLYKDRFSLALEYAYHFMFDENQDSGVLNLLSLDEVSFDIHIATLQIYWHLF